MLSFPTGTLTSKTFYFFWLDGSLHSFLAVNDPWPQLYLSLSSTWKRATQHTWAQGHKLPVNSSYYRNQSLCSSETQAALGMKPSFPASNRQCYKHRQNNPELKIWGLVLGRCRGLGLVLILALHSKIHIDGSMDGYMGSNLPTLTPNSSSQSLTQTALLLMLV